MRVRIVLERCYCRTWLIRRRGCVIEQCRQAPVSNAKHFVNNKEHHDQYLIYIKFHYDYKLT